MTKSATAFFWVLLGITATVFTSCGEGTATTPTRTGTVTQSGTYDLSVASTSQLLQDTATALAAKTADGGNVHFTSESNSMTGNTYAGSRDEGDMVFPDRVRMNLTSLAGDKQKQIELIAVSGQVYTRTAAGDGAWQTSSQGYLLPDPRSIGTYIDFTRGSRNFGQESLPDGRKTYHVQLDVDAALAAQEANKHSSDPAQQGAVEATRGSATTVDLWIGIDDLLIYQQKVVITTTDGGGTTETNFSYSHWGEAVQITRPCESC
ncbi:MAG: hypothetical protein ACYCXF_03980 [Thermoleophilia bacterium]